MAMTSDEIDRAFWKLADRGHNVGIHIQRRHGHWWATINDDDTWRRYRGDGGTRHEAMLAAMQAAGVIGENDE